ncbi:MAG: UDP-glucose 4-epimerase GalE [Flavobacteriaceae bacterium]
MSVLVTGGAGYIGSHMVLSLVDAGRPTVVVDNLSTGVRANVHRDAELVLADIGDQPLMEGLMEKRGVEAIVHFAGSISVPDSISDPLGYYLNNTVKTRALIQAAVNTGVKHFIFSSTAATYGIAEVNPITEDAPQNPISPYGASKLMSERMLADTAVAHDFRFVALRYFNVAGADPEGRSGQSTPRATHLIKVAAQAALGQRDRLEIFGTDYDTPDGTCIRDYIHVSDLAEAHTLALGHLEGGGESGIYNCGYGRGYSVREVIAAVKQASGVDFAVVEAPRRAGDPEALIAGADRIREAFGWQPKLDDLDRIVAHALAWERHVASRAA